MLEQDASGADFYVIRYEALFLERQGYGKRKPLASVVAMPHGEDCPPNAVAGPFFTRYEAERVRYEKRGEFTGGYRRAERRSVGV